MISHRSVWTFESRWEARVESMIDFFVSSRRRHTRFDCDWSSDVCSSDLTITRPTRGQAGSQGSQRVGRVIVAAQIAITLVLVVGAGLLGRSLMKVLEVNPGFRVDKIVTMDVSLPWVDDPKAKASQAIFFSNLIDRLKQIPAVRKVGATSGLPMNQDGGRPLVAPTLRTPGIC